MTHCIGESELTLMMHVTHTGRTRDRGDVARKRKEGSYFENPPQGNGGTIDDPEPREYDMHDISYVFECVVFQI